MTKALHHEEAYQGQTVADMETGEIYTVLHVRQMSIIVEDECGARIAYQADELLVVS